MSDYAIIFGYWKDNNSQIDGYIVKLSCDSDGEEDDDNIFFYFNSEEDLKNSIGETSVEDFVITEYELIK